MNNRVIILMPHQTQTIIILFSLVVIRACFEITPYDQSVQVSALEPSLTQAHYFDLSNMPQSILNQQWYAFVLLTTSNMQFWKKFEIKLDIVDSQTNQSKDLTIECGEDQVTSTYCFISWNQINPSKEYLKVEVRYSQSANATLKLDIDTVQSIKLGQPVSINQSSSDINRLYSLDFSDLPTDWRLLALEMKDEKQGLSSDGLADWGFMTSLSTNPPRKSKKDRTSEPQWEDFSIITYTSQNDIKGKPVLTILLQLGNSQVYSFTAKIINHTVPVRCTEGVNRFYRYGTTRLVLDFGKNRQEEMKTVAMFQGGDKVRPSNYSFNGRHMTEEQFFMNLAISSLFPLDQQESQNFVVDSSVESIAFDLKTEHKGIQVEKVQLMTVSLRTVNYSTPVLSEDFMFMDKFRVNQPRFLYLPIRTVSKEDKISLFVYIQSEEDFKVTFRHCKHLKSIMGCIESFEPLSTSSDKSTKFPEIVSTMDKDEVYALKDIKLQFVTLPSAQNFKSYQSLVIVEISSSSLGRYDFFFVKQIEHQLTPGKVLTGVVRNNIDYFSFTVPESPAFTEARVHLVSVPDEQFFGSNALPSNAFDIHFQSLDVGINRSLTFKTPSPGKTYYVMIGSEIKVDYQVHLGYVTENIEQSTGKDTHVVRDIQLKEGQSAQYAIKPNQGLLIEVQFSSKAVHFITHSQKSLAVCQVVSSTLPNPVMNLSSLQTQTCAFNGSSTLHRPTSEELKVYMILWNQNSQNLSVQITLETISDPSSDSQPPVQSQNLTINFFQLRSGIGLEHKTAQSVVDCFNTTLQDNTEKFAIIKAQQDRSFEKAVLPYLDIQFSLDGKNLTMNQSIHRDSMVISFDPQTWVYNNLFQICVGYKQQSANYLMYRPKNITFMPEYTYMGIQGDSVLSFMSRGQGIIEIDACTSNFSARLANSLEKSQPGKDIFQQSDNQNNLLYFNSNGMTYLSIQSDNEASVRWRAVSTSTDYDGKGYKMYSAQTFKLTYLAEKETVQLQVEPIKLTHSPEINEIVAPEILNVTYKLAMTKETSNLQRGINCQKGNYYGWSYDVSGDKALEQVVGPLLTKDMLGMLKGFYQWDESVMAILKAEVLVQWNSGLTEQYRFFYPEVKFILPNQEKQNDSGHQKDKQPSKDQSTSIDKHQQEQINKPSTLPQSQSDSGLSVIAIFGFIVLGLVIVGALFAGLLLIRWVRRRYQAQSYEMNEEVELGSDVLSSSAGNEVISHNKIPGK